jgi:hypothetical protein
MNQFATMQRGQYIHLLTKEVIYNKVRCSHFSSDFQVELCIIKFISFTH